MRISLHPPRAAEDTPTGGPVVLVDAAAWWLTDPHGGEHLAHALLTATCTAEVTTEYVYLALITPPGQSETHTEDFPS